MKLFELSSGARDYRFSPFVWRILLALEHKGLAYERVPCRFTDKSAFAPSGAQTVPTIEDEGKWVSDSWAIACYLEDRYPDRPSLFGGESGRGMAHFIHLWSDRAILAALFPMLAADICALLEPEDAHYFRTTREKRLGRTLEEAASGRETAVLAFRQTLWPLETALAARPFLGGDKPYYADYALFGPFQWARCCSRFEVLEDGSAIAAWRERMLDLHDGLARRAQRP